MLPEEERAARHLQTNREAVTFIEALLEIARGQRILLQEAYKETVAALASALESKDTGTRAHSQRVQHYAVELAKTLRADLADGVWVSLWGADQIARVSADGEISSFELPPGSEPHGLALDAEGALWVALESGFVIRLSL